MTGGQTGGQGQTRAAEVRLDGVERQVEGLCHVLLAQPDQGGQQPSPQVRGARTAPVGAAPADGVAPAGGGDPAGGQDTAERARRAREANGNGPAAGQERAAAARANAQAQQLAREVYARVGEHNKRLARIDRLTEIFDEQGDTAKLDQLKQLRQRETASFQKDMADLEQKLGPELYGRLRAAIDGPDSGPQRTREASGSSSQGVGSQRQRQADQQPAPAARRGAGEQESAGGGQ